METLSKQGNNGVIVSNDLYNMLGRLDGKMDMVLTNSTSLGIRVDHHAEQINELGLKIVTVEASTINNRKWLISLMTAIGLIISIVALFNKHSPL